MASTVSAVSICNMALTRLGEQQITTLTENSKAARLCNANFDIFRDSFLSDFDWPFAIKRATLAASATAPNHEWTYAYPLPDDCLRLIRTYDEVQQFADNTYEVEEGAIQTDQTTVKIEYIARIENYNQWDRLAIDAFADRIAAELAYPVTQQPAMPKQRWEIYEAKLAAARGAANRQGSPDVYEPFNWTDSRSGGDIA